jgi:membrane protein implicated in regulation of membrane protease activity
VRYTLLQLPGWVVAGLILLLLDRWFDLPAWFVWVAITLWIGKDIVMFSFVRTAYEQVPEESAYGLIGASAVARNRLDPSGHVQVHGELWKAELVQGVGAVEKGQKVVVRNVRGLTLLVQPDSSGR